MGPLGTSFVTAVAAAVATAGVTFALVGGPPAPPMPAPIAAAPVAPIAAPVPRPGADATAGNAAAPAPAGWVIPDVGALPDDDWGRAVRYGRTLIVCTYAVIGPEVPDATRRFAGNNLSCQSCHIKAATAQFGLPFQGVFADFPNYRARSGTVGTIEDRINGCMTRSMNGKPLPIAGPEMTAMVAYLKFMSQGRPVGAPTPGRGPGALAELSRSADPAHGKDVYARVCAVCHGPSGEGHRAGVAGDAKGYAFPPLWGDDSFNDGAGMARLIGAATFVHNNMPDGTTWRQPALSGDEAWDVASYVLAQPRPHKANLDRDYPKPLERPADSNYGPYVDGFSPEQHRLGPFAPIRAAIAQLKSSQPPGGKPAAPTGDSE